MKKMRDKLLHYLPIILQSLLFITLFLLPSFSEDHTEIGGDLVIFNIQNWLWLIIPPITIQLFMIFLPDMIKRRFNSGWFLTTFLLSAFFLASIIYPVSAFLTPYKSSFPLAQVIKSKLPAGEAIYQYKVFLYGIEAYTDIRTSVVDSFGEMSYGMQKLPAHEKSRYFLSQQEFFRLVKEKKGGVYCVAVGNKDFDELKKEFPRLQVIWSNDIQYFIRLLH